MKTREDHVARGQLILAQFMDPEKDAVQYGVPGMKWGKRKARGSSAAPAARPKSADHIEARQLNKKKLSELSNDELQRLTKRLDLEAKYRKTHPTKMQKAQKVFKQVVSTAETAQKVYKFVASTEQGKRAIAQGQAAIKAAAKK